MRAPRLVKIAAMLASALVAALGVAVAMKPALRHSLVALLNDPADLPAFESDSRVRLEPGARECAVEVAKLLPGALATIEAEHGRAFAKAPIVAVYDSPENYARANGLGDERIAAVSRAGRAVLSPDLCRDSRERLQGVLTHELSHVHFFGWRSRVAKRPPQWFTEGLAVLVSHGGAAEGVSDARAARAIRDGFRIVLDDSPWMDFAAIGFEKEPKNDTALSDYAFRQRLAFRQAAIFVGWLRDGNPSAFLDLLRRLERNDAFDAAFGEIYRSDAKTRWTEYVVGLKK